MLHLQTHTHTLTLSHPLCVLFPARFITRESPSPSNTRSAALCWDLFQQKPDMRSLPLSLANTLHFSCPFPFPSAPFHESRRRGGGAKRCKIRGICAKKAVTVQTGNFSELKQNSKAKCNVLSAKIKGFTCLFLWPAFHIRFVLVFPPLSALSRSPIPCVSGIFN